MLLLGLASKSAIRTHPKSIRREGKEHEMGTVYSKWGHSFAGAMLMAFGLSESAEQSQPGLAAMFLRQMYKSDGYDTKFQCACEGRKMRREQI